MATITSEHTHASYVTGKKLFEDQALNRAKANRELVEGTGMNPNSATYYVDAYLHMRRGEVYTRNINEYSVEYFLRSIRKDEGDVALLTGLNSLQLHIEYLKSIDKHYPYLVRVHQQLTDELASSTSQDDAGHPLGTPQEPTVTAGRTINGRTLVSSREELLESCIRFLGLGQGSTEERKFFLGRLKNVRRFVVISNAQGTLDFIPGAYSAFSDSYALDEWIELGEKGCRTPGRLFLDQALASDKIDVGHPNYGRFKEELQRYCSDRGVVPSASDEPLRFWTLFQTQGRFEFSAADKGEQKGSEKSAVDAWERTLMHMINTVKNTTDNSNGQTVERVLKDKEMRLNKEELHAHATELRKAQNGRCAISGLKLHCLGESSDNECVYSLDRINSDGHYERGNLQLVCRFINRWKSDTNDLEFRRLMALLRQSEHNG